MIIPSVDIMGGKVVQLEQGKKKVLEEADVEARLADFSRFGEVALIDLDAAMGTGDNLQLIERLVRKFPCRVGGGIRSVEKAKNLIVLGAERVIIGSSAFAGDEVNLEFLKELNREIGRGSLMVSLDTLGGKIAVAGWKKTLNLDLATAAKSIAPLVGGFLVTCVDREGLMGGTDRSGLETVREALKSLGDKSDERVRIVAAGGIKSPEEMRSLSAAGYDMQLGMSIYTGAVPVSEAFVASVDFTKGLVPTVVKDSSGQVLMLAYSNEESLRKTFSTGLVTFWSRSRNSLWTKGETSGNTLRFVDIRTDCDCDSLLVTCVPKGPSCHTEEYSCFGPQKHNLDELHDVIADRFAHPQPNSYTSKLDADRIRRKINEECFELVDAKGEDEIVWEAADLMYFTTAYLAKKGIPMAAIWNELRKRRRKKS